jgi:hypothetical protein
VNLDPPAVYDVAREGIGLVDGASIKVTLDLSGGRVVAVHISPGLNVKDDKSALWRSLDEVLGIGEGRAVR